MIGVVPLPTDTAAGIIPQTPDNSLDIRLHNLNNSSCMNSSNRREYYKFEFNWKDIIGIIIIKICLFRYSNKQTKYY